MGPTELEEVLNFEPLTPMRLTLASGSVVDIRRREGLRITGLSLCIEDVGLTGLHRLRLISIPNITMLEPFVDGPLTARGMEEHA